MMRTALVLLLFTAALHAAPLQRDLGLGLTYFRASELPGDLPDVPPSPLVLDLRFVAGDSASAEVLRGWLRFHATSTSPVFVLVNRATSAPLLQATAQVATEAAVLIFGPAENSPHIAIAPDEALEKRAFDALAAGASPESLLAENPTKPRNDESTFSGTRRELADLGPDDSELSDHAPAEPALIDHALQRAVHVHRALRALRRLESRP